MFSRKNPVLLPKTHTYIYNKLPERLPELPVMGKKVILINNTRGKNLQTVKLVFTGDVNDKHGLIKEILKSGFDIAILTDRYFMYLLYQLRNLVMEFNLPTNIEFTYDPQRITLYVKVSRSDNRVINEIQNFFLNNGIILHKLTTPEEKQNLMKKGYEFGDH